MIRLFALLVAGALGAAPASAVPLPDPAIDVPLAGTPATSTAVFAGGCFWGVEGVFEHVQGVTRVVSGYAGGTAETANYREVSSGRSGHAEAVRITYDPAKISYGRLLKVFFAVAHDPTQLNRQGPDTGTQYRSAIFTAGPEQKRVAERYVAQLQQARAYPRPIVTQVVPLEGFYEAEAYHQDYMAKHPDQPYIVVHDRPKLENLKRQLPALYRPAATTKTQKTR